MSEADFAAAEEAAHAEEAEEDQDDESQVEAEEGSEEEAQPEAKAKDWEKIAHDREGAVAKERSRRKAEQAARRELEARLEKLESERSARGGEEDALAALIANLRDDDEDPITDIATVKKALKTFMDRQKADQEREAGQTQQQRATDKLIRTMREHEVEFADEHPDYDDAQKHYKAERQAELEEMGYSGQRLQQALAADLFGIVQTALSAGKDPAEAVYKLAKKRGFAVKDETTDKLKKIGEAARAGAKAPSAVGKTQAMSWKDVASLKGAARDAAWAKLREQERRAG